MLKTLLSINEAKFSALIIGLLIALGFGLYIAYEKGDIPNNLTTIITTLVLTIGGVNAIHGATSLMSGKGGLLSADSGQAAAAASETTGTAAAQPLKTVATGSVAGLSELPSPQNPVTPPSAQSGSASPASPASPAAPAAGAIPMAFRQP